MSVIINKLNLELGDACQLDCSYCYIKYRNRDIEYAINNNLDRIQLIKWDSIVITGGEPALYDIESIMEKIDSNSYEILTNGIDEISINTNKKISFTVSLDGNEKIMERQRGVTKTQYHKILANIENYSKKRSVCVNFVVTRESIPFLNTYFKNEKINTNIQYFFTPICAYDKNMLSQDDLKKLLDIQYKIIENFNFHINLNSSLTDKFTFCSIYQNGKLIQFVPYYLMKYNIFYCFGFYFTTLDELLSKYEDLSFCITKWIKDVYLLEKQDNYLFDPYSIIEMNVSEIKIYVKTILHEEIGF